MSFSSLALVDIIVTEESREADDGNLINRLFRYAAMTSNIVSPFFYFPMFL